MYNSSITLFLSTKQDWIKNEQTVTHTLPTIARNNLREAIKFIQAVYPSASDIKFTDAMAGTPAQWYAFQFQNKVAYGVAIMNALYMDGRICIEHPYTPVLWRYNDEGAS